MKNILILGGNGFLGTNIIRHIDEHLSDQYRVIVFDKFPRNPFGESFQCVTRSYAGDFMDSVLLEKVFDENQIEMVIHSLSTTVPALSLNAKYDVESNLVPTIELLNCMVKHQINDIIYISSGGAVYGDNSSNKHVETEDVFPISSYGVVKLAIEKYLKQYASLYEMRPLIVRLSNPYGPYHYSKKQGICNVALESALRNDEFSVWGNGKARKDYIYVTDFVNILFLLMQKGAWGEVINVGSGQTLSVDEILCQIKAMLPSFSWSYTDASLFDVAQFGLNTSKLHSIIGDYTFTNMKDGLEKTLQWYRATGL